MKPYQYEIRKAAIVKHKALQAYALERLQVYENEQADNDWRAPLRIKLETLTPTQRKKALDILEAMGQPRCLVAMDETGEPKDTLPYLLPTFSIRTPPAESSWTVYHIYSRPEIQAYIKGFQVDESEEEVAMQYDMGAYDGGSGRKFRHGGSVSFHRSRAVHSQSGGLDI